MRRQERLATCWSPAIHRDLKQRFLELIDSYAAGEGGVRVNAKLLKAAQTRKDTKGQNAARLLIETGAAPRVAPRKFSARSLEGHKKAIGSREVTAYVSFTESLFSLLQALLKQLVPRHCPPPSVRSLCWINAIEPA